MKRFVFFLFVIIVSNSTFLYAQRRPGSRNPKGFSLSNLTGAGKEIPDSLLVADSTSQSGKRITAYRIASVSGTPDVIRMDTQKLNFANTTLVESQALSVGYTGNYGSAAQTRIFSERKESRDFIFADPYDYYITDHKNAVYYNTKIPYTNALYTSEGGGESKNERLKGTLTMNFGPQINVGGDVDYIYSRGQYKNSGNKLLSYRLFGRYTSDHYEAYAHLSNYNFITYENGGLANDSLITHPDNFLTGRQQNDPKTFAIRYPVNAWNRIRGTQYYLHHRYNLGFWRELAGKVDSLGYPETRFVPVSSFIHTLEYQENRRRFVTAANSDLNDYFLTPDGQPRVFGLNIGETEENKTTGISDRTSSWYLRNTFGLSLREGFQDWAKFGITAFIIFDKRRFQMPATLSGLSYDPDYGSGLDPQPSSLNFLPYQQFNEFSTFLGAELSKKQGHTLTYDARGELGVVGDDIGEVRVTGNLQARFKLFKKDALIRAEGALKNIRPAFYLRHFHSRYFWWDKQLDMEQRLYAGGTVDLESTKTRISAGVESMQHYTFINRKGFPEQKNGNLQVVTVRFKQDFMYRAFGWENEAVYQISSDKGVLPLPQLSVYSNLFVHFKAAKVLTIQLGANLYYHTSYHAPYYEPATQQFQHQDEVKVGGYPLVNAYVNFHLKQARFFVMAYNLSSKFADPNYFSLAHYPLNPMLVKMGIAVTFNN